MSFKLNPYTSQLNVWTAHISSVQLMNFMLTANFKVEIDSCCLKNTLKHCQEVFWRSTDSVEKLMKGWKQHIHSNETITRWLQNHFPTGSDITDSIPEVKKLLHASGSHRNQEGKKPDTEQSVKRKNEDPSHPLHIRFPLALPAGLSQIH